MKIEETEEFKIFEKLKKLGLVFSKQKCEKTNCPKHGCDLDLKIRKRTANSDNHILSWRCSRCGTYKSVLDGSFFSLFKKPAKLVLALIKCWSAQLTISKTQSMMELNFNQKLSEDMIGNLFKKLRQTCTVAIDKANITLGGQGKIVEIDESLYAKVKHWKGKY